MISDIDYLHSETDMLQDRQGPPEPSSCTISGTLSENICHHITNNGILPINDE